MTFALDSWAVLRLLEGTEPAASRVEEILDEGRPVMSWVNLGEVFYIVRRDQGEDDAHEVVRDLRLRLDLDRPSEHRVLNAAAIKADHPMAYPDAFAAATAAAHDATLLTGDPELLLDSAPWQWEDLRATSHEACPPSRTSMRRRAPSVAMPNDGSHHFHMRRIYDGAPNPHGRGFRAGHPTDRRPTRTKHAPARVSRGRRRRMPSHRTAEPT